MRWYGPSPNCWLSRCRAKVYISCTASRRQPPRSAARHNLLKPRPSRARWSGPKCRRSKVEPLPLPRRHERQAAPTELSGDRGPIDAMGRAARHGNFVAASNRWSAAMPQPNDLSRSLVALDQNSTIIAVVELSHSSWLVAGMLPGIERQPRKKLEPSPERLLALLH